MQAASEGPVVGVRCLKDGHGIAGVVAPVTPHGMMLAAAQQLQLVRGLGCSGGPSAVGPAMSVLLLAPPPAWGQKQHSSHCNALVLHHPTTTILRGTPPN